MKVLWQDHTFVMKCTLNALCLLNVYSPIKNSDSSHTVFMYRHCGILLESLVNLYKRN